jgi:hypothetical protein
MQMIIRQTSRWRPLTAACGGIHPLQTSISARLRSFNRPTARAGPRVAVASASSESPPVLLDGRQQPPNAKQHKVARSTDQPAEVKCKTEQGTESFGPGRYTGTTLKCLSLRCFRSQLHATDEKRHRRHAVYCCFHREPAPQAELP